MKLTISAIGRMRKGPELDLVQDYLSRFEKQGRSLGLGPVSVVEAEDKKGGGKAAEAALLQRPLDGPYIALDERGRVMSSPDFARILARHRDDGASALGFVIGGADGLDAPLVDGAAEVLSFGKMVWPHMLARVMLAEQLYRAVNILAGTPYHRV